MAGSWIAKMVIDSSCYTDDDGNGDFEISSSLVFLSDRTKREKSIEAKLEPVGKMIFSVLSDMAFFHQ